MFSTQIYRAGHNTEVIAVGQHAQDLPNFNPDKIPARTGEVGSLKMELLAVVVGE